VCTGAAGGDWQHPRRLRPLLWALQTEVLHGEEEARRGRGRAPPLGAGAGSGTGEEGNDIAIMAEKTAALSRELRGE
jgi:hypothetical protein